MSGGPILRKYGVETTINFPLFEIDGVDFRVDAVDSGANCTVMKNEGAEATCTNDFTDEGNGYSLVLDATEMSAARIVVYVVDSGTKVWLDCAVIIETYGNASAQHAFDFDTALTAASIVDDWETQSQADPTGFHVNVKEVNGTAQTAGDVTALVVTADAAIDVAVADLANGTDGLGALKTLIDTVNTDLANGTDGLGALKTLIDTVNTDLSNGTDGLGALKALIDTLDTVADAIKAKTDDLTFTIANKVNANVHYVDDDLVTGSGGSGDRWRPA